MSTTESLSLSDEVLPVVKVHATAAMAVLHSFMRRGCQKRVIGTVLGLIKEGTSVFEVTDCFEVPYDEKSTEFRVVIDQDYHKRMYDFHRRVNKREGIIGWFSTTTAEGEFINDTTYLFNDFYSKQCRKPILLVVDTTLSTSAFSIRAFQGKSLAIANATDDSFANVFMELQVKNEFSPSEASSIYHMLKFQDQKSFSSPEILSTIPTDDLRLKTSLEQLINVIDSLSDYVDRVIDNKEEALPSIGMSLSDAVGILQSLSAEDIGHVYHDKVQDLLMVSYLTTLTKVQVQISEKLNSIL